MAYDFYQIAGQLADQRMQAADNKRNAWLGGLAALSTLAMPQETHSAITAPTEQAQEAYLPEGAYDDGFIRESTPQPPQTAPKSGSGAKPASRSNKYEVAARNIADKYQLPHSLFLSLIQQESSFNPNAKSPVGAVGLTQLMPSTARELGVDPHDPMQNLEGGARYLRQQLDRFGSIPLALAAYNAGPGTVRKYKTIPPIKETRNYVKNILKNSETKGYKDGGLVVPYDAGHVQNLASSFVRGEGI